MVTLRDKVANVLFLFAWCLFFTCVVVIMPAPHIKDPLAGMAMNPLAVPSPGFIGDMADLLLLGSLVSMFLSACLVAGRVLDRFDAISTERKMPAWLAKYHREATKER